MKLVEKDGAYVAENAVVVGDVRLGEGVSIWYNAVLRGDMAPITVGENSNIQDGSVLHCDPGMDLTIGKNVVVGHMAMIHARKVGDGCLIGINAVLLSGAEIGEGSLVGAGAVIREGQVVPPHSIVVGVPGKIIGQTTESQREGFVEQAKRYRLTALRHVEGRVLPGEMEEY
jgi:carbonic anhydrase/acetyltransferase-like protein (isoleucine patch superfamily)